MVTHHRGVARRTGSWSIDWHGMLVFVTKREASRILQWLDHAGEPYEIQDLWHKGERRGQAVRLEHDDECVENWESPLRRLAEPDPAGARE